MNEQETSADESGMEFGALHVATRRVQPKWQFSLWALFVWLTMFAIAGAAIRWGAAAILFLFILAVAVCGLGTFGFVAYWFVNAIFTRSSSKARRTGRLMLDGVLGFSLIAWAAAVGVWLTDRSSLTPSSEIDRRYIRLREALVSEDYAAAYSLMSPSYRAANSLATFQGEVDIHVVGPLFPGRSLEIDGARASLCPLGEGPHTAPHLVWERVGGAWYFTGEEDW